METAQTQTGSIPLPKVQPLSAAPSVSIKPTVSNTGTVGQSEKKYSEEKAVNRDAELKSELKNRLMKRCDEYFGKMSETTKKEFFEALSIEGQQVTMNSFYKKLQSMLPKDIETKISPTLQVIDFYQQSRKVSDRYGKHAIHFKNKYYIDFKTKIDCCGGNAKLEDDMYKVLSAVLVKLTTSKKKDTKIYYSPTKLKELMAFLSEGTLPTTKSL